MSRAGRKAVTLSGLRDQLDSIEAKLDAQAKLLQLLVPNDSKTPLPSQIVATNEPDYKPSSHGVTNPRTRIKDLYNTPCRSSVLGLTQPKQHPTLGSL
jgi:hypothetical protein